VRPLALKALGAYGIPTYGSRSKGRQEFARPGAPHPHFTFTVCDGAAGETFPVWPDQPLTAHWDRPDPAAVEGNGAVRERAFVDTFVVLQRRIRLRLALPLANLERMAIQSEIKALPSR